MNLFKLCRVVTKENKKLNKTVNHEYQIRVLPEQAANETGIKQYLERDARDGLESFTQFISYQRLTVCDRIRERVDIMKVGFYGRIIEICPVNMD